MPKPLLVRSLMAVLFAVLVVGCDKTEPTSQNNAAPVGNLPGGGNNKDKRAGPPAPPPIEPVR